MSVQVLLGDCRDTLKTLPERSIQCCVTSPPFFGLRSYLPAGHPDKGAEIGSAETPRAYVANLVAVFREVWRVLRDDGTCWVNLGDSHASAWVCNRRNAIGNGSLVAGKRADRPNRLVDGLKEKDLIGIPWMAAFALRDDGWYLRSDIVWAKGNCMPESVQDRPTRSHEYMFLLSKQERYYYDALAIREPNSSPEQLAHNHRYARTYDAYDGRARETGQPGNVNNIGIHARPGGVGRNKRSVWAVNPVGYPDAHYAVMPPKLIEPCILAGTSERGCCPACKAPYKRVVERESMQVKHGPKAGHYGSRTTDGLSRTMVAPAVATTVGWTQTCTCNAGHPIPCTVIDPFGGSGTTAMVATKHRRDAILCELSEDYCELINKRLTGVQVTLPFDAMNEEEVS